MLTDTLRKVSWPHRPLDWLVRTKGHVARVPAGVRVYAIGDIHGRADLLARLQGMILADAQARPCPSMSIVYLGDYVDRGPHSRDVVEMLCDPARAPLPSVFLRGNHEQAMLDFLADPVNYAGWLRFGGDATVLSYGIRAPTHLHSLFRLEFIRERLAETLPPAHREFLSTLRYTHEVGDYFFAHAGVDPHRPLDQQQPRDLLWIRETFLDDKRDFGKVVVHGHSISERPVVRANRIGIDTGACFTNVLTCLVLEEDTRRFLDTAAA